jgi:hypothetical protein
MIPDKVKLQVDVFCFGVIREVFDEGDGALAFAVEDYRSVLGGWHREFETR